ncbi:MAG: hypothetical protein SFY67_15170 [Candidatus Melainabacteria bacterium]|nr:hypothetical protein [Candidatus Melainabacteria bacterium]
MLEEETHLKPSIKFQFLQITIHDLQYEDDGDWLNITASCTTEDSMVQVHGPIVTAAQLDAFFEQIRKLSRGLYGTAVLASEEPYLNIQIKAEKSWQALMTVEITPDYFNQKHSYTTSLDRADLENLTAQLNEVKNK